MANFANACTVVQINIQRTEVECDTGAHLNFETYGNLKSAVWRQNPPFPKDAGVLACDVSYGKRHSAALTQVVLSRLSSAADLTSDRLTHEAPASFSSGRHAV